MKAPRMLKHKAIANNYDMMAISYCYNRYFWYSNLTLHQILKTYEIMLV